MSYSHTHHGQPCGNLNCALPDKGPDPLELAARLERRERAEAAPQEAGYDPNKFGRNYKKHLWVRMRTEVAMQCERENCGARWEPHQQRSDIKWCKGVGA